MKPFCSAWSCLRTGNSSDGPAVPSWCLCEACGGQEVLLQHGAVGVAIDHSDRSTARGLLLVATATPGAGDLHNVSWICQL